MLVLRLHHRWWSLPLVREEEDDRNGGGALDTPLWVALLSMLGSGGLVKSGTLCLGLFSLLSSPL